MHGPIYSEVQVQAKSTLRKIEIFSFPAAKVQTWHDFLERKKTKINLRFNLFIWLINF